MSRQRVITRGGIHAEVFGYEDEALVRRAWDEFAALDIDDALKGIVRSDLAEAERQLQRRDPREGRGRLRRFIVERRFQGQRPREKGVPGLPQTAPVVGGLQLVRPTRLEGVSVLERAPEKDIRSKTAGGERRSTGRPRAAALGLFCMPSGPTVEGPSVLGDAALRLRIRQGAPKCAPKSDSESAPLGPGEERLPSRLR
jgi:hypothetical protein